MTMQTFGSVKQTLTLQLLSIPVLRRNTYLLYSLWSVVIILSYYEFGFQVIRISSDHVLNFAFTSIINVIAYVFVEKMHSRLGEKRLIVICVIFYAIAHVLEEIVGDQKHAIYVSSIQIKPNRWKTTEKYMYGFMYEKSWQTVVSMKEAQLSCETGLDIAEQLGVTGLYGFIFSYSTEFYNNLISETAKEEAKMGFSKPIPITIRDITLKELVYPRISKVCSWLHKRYSNVFEPDFGKIKLISNAHVLILQTEILSDNAQNVYAENDIKDDERTHFKDTFSAQNYLKVLLKRYIKSSVPLVVLCYLTLDENGNIVKKDKKLISRVLKRTLPILTSSSIELVYVINSETNIDLKSLSCTIQYKLGTKGCANLVYCKTFDAERDHRSVKKRIGLYLERMFETAIVDIVNNKKCDWMTLSSYDGGISNITVKTKTGSDIQSVYDKIISYLQHSSPDNCEMHEVKVLLERSPDVAAYGFEDTKMTTYVKDQANIPDVKLYLNKYFPELKNKMVFKIWEKNTKISKCVVQQGSKIVRGDSKFGTLGMFLEDEKNNIYFTTCSHVVEKNDIARSEENTVIGRSVFSVDTGPDINHSELLDLSIVKVEAAVKQRCQFGLRNLQNHHQNSQIVDEESVHRERKQWGSLRVYKWGAATSLTLGTYKGWIAAKNRQDRFDQNMHQIVSESESMFEEGDSGSLVCIEATGSPDLDNDSAAFIFVGKLMPENESMSADLGNGQWFYCYHVSKVFQQEHIDDVHSLEPCLERNTPDNSISSGQAVHS